MMSTKYCNDMGAYSRYVTREVTIGNLTLGGNNPIRVQSMTTTDTMDTIKTVEQSIRMIEAGCELVRITAPSINVTDGVNMLREHVRPSVRMHYAIMSGGDVPNVVPEYAKIWMWVRDSKREGVETVFSRVKEIAQGAAMIAGVEAKVTVQTGDYELLVNRTGASALQKNWEILGPINYTAEEIAFAKKIQEVQGGEQIGLDGKIHPLKETSEHPTGGSTDVGDISWIVPEITLVATTAPPNTAWHGWSVVACGGIL